MSANGAGSLKERIDAIEETYEYMLAYAAQGLSGEENAGPTTQMRSGLEAAMAALDGFSEALRQAVQNDGGKAAGDFAEFLDVVERDAESTRAAFRLVLAQKAISSQIVDNLNALIHLRALLTDLFLIDEALGSRRTG